MVLIDENDAALADAAGDWRSRSRTAAKRGRSRVPAPNLVRLDRKRQYFGE